MAPPDTRSELDLARASGQLDEFRASIGGDLDPMQVEQAPEPWITD